MNPPLMAQDYIAAFQRIETPECTDGREGYVWFRELAANVAHTRLGAPVGDFDRKSFASRKRWLSKVIEWVLARYPTGCLECRVGDTDDNYADRVGEDRRCVGLLPAALEAAGATPKPLRSAAAPAGRHSSHAVCLPRTSSSTARTFTRATSACRSRPSKKPTRWHERSEGWPRRTRDRDERRRRSEPAWSVQARCCHSAGSDNASEAEGDRSTGWPGPGVDATGPSLRQVLPARRHRLPTLRSRSRPRLARVLQRMFGPQCLPGTRLVPIRLRLRRQAWPSNPNAAEP